MNAQLKTPKPRAGRGFKLFSPAHGGAYHSSGTSGTILVQMWARFLLLHVFLPVPLQNNSGTTFCALFLCNLCTFLCNLFYFKY